VTEAEFLRTTRASYDAVAEGYAGRFRDELDARPLDRAVLAAFAELVRAGPQALSNALCRSSAQASAAKFRHRREARCETDAGL
jgi:hypothetical protein